MLTVDHDTLIRRQRIYERIKQRSYQPANKVSSESNQYKSIVDEFHVDFDNPLVGLLDKIFISGRKLKPIVKKRVPISCDNIEKAKVYVHVIKAENVPMRLSYIEGYLKQENKKKNKQAPPSGTVPNVPSGIRDQQE